MQVPNPSMYIYSQTRRPSGVSLVLFGGRLLCVSEIIAHTGAPYVKIGYKSYNVLGEQAHSRVANTRGIAFRYIFIQILSATWYLKYRIQFVALM